MHVWQDNMEHGTMPDAKPAAFARVLCRAFLRGMLAVYVLLLCACNDSPLDPDKPVTLTMWRTGPFSHEYADRPLQPDGGEGAGHHHQCHVRQQYLDHP